MEETVQKEIGGLADGVVIVRSSKVDLVNHPPHYERLTPEPIDVIESWELSFNLGQVVKYIARAGFKEGTTADMDLRKAAFYLHREIERLNK